MKANELRTGNWYLSTKFQVPVICGVDDFYEIYTRADGSAEYTVDDIFQPLPLTEEWLLKFKWYKIMSLDKRFVFADIEYYSISADGSLYFNDAYTCTDIKYVHQLQNLYFALTGEELTIK
jgi:hypothetical protein